MIFGESLGGLGDVLLALSWSLVTKKPPSERLVILLDLLADELGVDAVLDDGMILVGRDAEVPSIVALQTDRLGDAETAQLVREAEEMEALLGFVRLVRIVPDMGWVFLLLAPDATALANLRSTVESAIEKA